jgi:DNA-binding SARP family transcriptional activator
MARLELQLFGYPSAHLSGCGIDLTLRKGLALLAYLAETAGPVGRDHLAGLLWPEADEEASRARLRRTLHKIRIAFAADVIDADRTSLQLARSLDTGVDTQAFEAACSAGELNEALRLYGGDFLEGLRIEACPNSGNGRSFAGKRCVAGSCMCWKGSLSVSWRLASLAPPLLPPHVS